MTSPRSAARRPNATWGRKPPKRELERELERGLGLGRRELQLGLLIALLAVALACSPTDPEATGPAATGRLSVAASLGASDPADLKGFARALEPRTLVFPQDHGPHPAFKTEWWYWIGNLSAKDGRRFGYQLTFFRSALAPPPSAPPGEHPSVTGAGSTPAATAEPAGWATRQLYMAHFALTDVDGATFDSFERFSRGAAGLAGARSDPFRVWLDDWSVQETGSEGRWLLRAAEESIQIELALEPGKPRVLHGDRGLSRKGEASGAASYYYSRSRMPTRGRLILGGEVLAVEGSSWFDREWSTSLLAPDEVGWDWLGAQLDDGRELMFFRLRRRDGTSAWVDGTLIDADGSSRALITQGVEFTRRESWTSLETGVTYPAGFRLELPAEELSLEIVPLLPDQELRLSFVYWEGAVDIFNTGSSPGSSSGSVAGRGYLEMTGYGERASPR